MSHFNVNYPLPSHVLPSNSNDAFDSNFKNERQEEQASLSGSEDDTYPPYPDSQRPEQDFEETDPNNDALTAQTLNQDGNPKRPMNAFMIFARRRRPQVSAENQSMRTGEISKLLSKEWAAMPPSEKQFYIERAKQLKDKFNATYPDYVYRRRPNHSRRRRRTDGAGTRADNPIPADTTDDYSSMVDPSESSHVDSEELQADPVRDIRYSRQTTDASHPYADHGKYMSSSQARHSSHPYAPSDNSFRSNSALENRLPYVSSNVDRLNDLPPAGSLPSPRLQSGQTLQYPYSQGQGHSQGHSRTPPYGSEQLEIGDAWPRRVERPTSGWPDRTLASLTSQKQNTYPSPTGPSWSNSATSPSGTSGTSPSSNFPFQTLTTPFFPNPSHLQGYHSQSSSSPSPGTHSGSSQYDSNTHVPSMGVREFDDRAYAPSPSISPSNPYPLNANRDTLLYPQRHNSTSSRGLAPIQSISNYSNSSQPLHSAAAATGPSSNPYWPRDKVDGF